VVKHGVKGPILAQFNRDTWRMLARAFLTPMVALLMYFTLPMDGNRWIVSAGIGILATVIAVPYAVRHIGKIQAASHPLLEALAVISLLVSMVIVGFAAGYYNMAIRSDQFSGIHTKLDGLYFTIVTVGTVGYGDITPTGQGARALVSAQIMLNLTLIGTVVRIIGRAASDSRSRQVPQG
jgi:voltage-gated potassium channel